MAYTYQAGSRHQSMYSQKSTQGLLELFPMFGHPGISALEYAATIEPRCKRNTSASLSLKRKTTSSVHNENTTFPTTAQTDVGKAGPVQVIDEFASQQRRRGQFVNHTPRDFEMRTATQMVEVYRPSRPDNMNYSCPRASVQIDSSDVYHASTERYEYGSPGHSTTMEKRITVNRGAPVELDSKEVVLTTAPEVHLPPAELYQHSVSMPMTRVVTYKTKSSVPTGRTGREVNVGSASDLKHHQSEKKQRRQTPYRITTPKPINTARHAPLEPLVALHRMKRVNMEDESISSQAEESDGETATFQVIHRYFENQAKNPSPQSSIKSHTQPPDLSRIPLSVSPEPNAPKTSNENVAFPSTLDLEMPSEPPPAVPDRSPKRLKNPSFPLRTISVATTDSEFAFSGECHSSSHNKNSNVLHDHKKRTQKRVNVGQAARAGSSNLGRMAPPILGHAALTASSDLGLNDISFYLRNTGPTTDTQITTRQRKGPGIRMFRVKSKKSLAARVGYVEGAQQRARKPTPVPACAREMTTSGGTRHLRIVIPTDTLSGNQALALSVANTKAQYPKRCIPGPFIEETVCPHAGPEVERIISADSDERSISPPIASCSHFIPPEREKAQTHPPVSREEQTRARKLRDLHKIKGTPPASDMQHDTLSSPTQTPELAGAVEEFPKGKMERLEERINNLEKLNAELTGALARLIVGVEIEEGKMRREDVLRAWRLVGCEGTLRGMENGTGGEYGTVRFEGEGQGHVEGEEEQVET